MTWLPILSLLVYSAWASDSAPPDPTGSPKASTRHEATRIRSTHPSTTIIRWVGGYQDPQLYDESIAWVEDQDARAKKRKENQDKAIYTRTSLEEIVKIKAAKAQCTKEIEAKRRLAAEALVKQKAAEARTNREKAAKERLLDEKINKLSKTKGKR